MRRAIVIGINEYPNAPLTGCEFDALQIALFLRDDYGFGPGCVRLLTGARATRVEIWDRLIWGVTESEPGDELVISYSGHGAQEAARDGNGKIVRLQQILCPVDFSWGNPLSKITDGDWVNIMSRLVRGVRCVAILDSCYSGGMSERKIGGRLLDGGLRYLAAKEWGRAVGSLTSLQNHVTIKGFPVPFDIDHRNRDAAALGIKAKANFGSDALNMACLMGCGEGQTSAETLIEGHVRGVMTYHLLRALSAKPGVRLDSVMARVVSDVHQGGFEQVPCIFGMQSDKSFLWR